MPNSQISDLAKKGSLMLIICQKTYICEVFPKGYPLPDFWKNFIYFLTLVYLLINLLSYAR